MVKSTTHEDSLDDVFAALADPTRRAVIGRLCRGEATVGELAAPFDVSLPAVSRHLSVLERAGLIERRRRGRHQICTLRPENIAVAAGWLERHREFWADRLGALAAHLSVPDDASADHTPGESP